MDLAGAAGAIAQLKGAVRTLDTDDKDVIDLVLFVCETLFDADPNLRRVFMKAADNRLRADFPEDEFRLERLGVQRAKLRHGLREIVKMADL